jgi:hypothetical protein
VSVYERHPQGVTLRLILCIVAIVVGVLMFVDALHVGAAHKGLGVVEVTLGILSL